MPSIWCLRHRGLALKHHQSYSSSKRVFWQPTQGNPGQYHGKHLTLSLSFCASLFSVCSGVRVLFFIFLINDEYSNLRCVVLRSAWLCCLVSVTTLKSYFTSCYIAPVLSFFFSPHLFIYFFAHGGPISLFSLECKRMNDDDKRRKRKKEILPTFPLLLDSSQNSVTLSIILN